MVFGLHRRAEGDFARQPVEIAGIDRFVATMSKAKRKGRIFIDWLRNQRGSTAVLPYSARARSTVPVAVPVGWDELDGIDTAARWTIADSQALLDRARNKTLVGWGFAAQRLPDF